MSKLKDIDVTEVSVVARPANRRRFLMIKSEVDIMTVLEFIKAVTEKDVTEEIFKDDEDLKKVLSVLAEYAEVMPDDMLAAVSELTDRSLKKEEPPAGKEEDPGKKEEVPADKPDLKEVISILQGMVEEDDEETVEKSLENAIAKLNDMGKTEKGHIKIVEDALAQIGARLEVVEKNSGVKKGLDSDEEETQESGDKKALWPSISG